MKYLFGPVNSRRLGISLGVDLTPHKTCSLNCIYCECGETTNLTLERKEYVPTEAVISEIEDYLSLKPDLDFITFSGSGEPTLHSKIGEIINFIKSNYSDYKVAVLTNSTTMPMIEVRESIKDADVVVPSLDAATDEVAARIIRPAKGIHMNEIIDSLVLFRGMFTGKIILEIFLAEGINDSLEELLALKKAAARIKPDAVQLNSLDRPGAVEWIKPVPVQRLNEIRDLLSPLPVQVIGRPKYDETKIIERSNITEEILSIVKRRPSTADDLSITLGVNRREMQRVLDFMKDKDILIEIREERGVFYRPIKKKE